MANRARSCLGIDARRVWRHGPLQRVMFTDLRNPKSTRFYCFAKGGIMPYGVGVIHVQEPHHTWSRHGLISPALHRVDHEWVRNAREISPGQFAAVIEGGIDIGHIDAIHERV